VIFVVIVGALAMEYVDLCSYFINARLNEKGWLDCRRIYFLNARSNNKGWLDYRRNNLIVCIMIGFEMSCIVSSNMVERDLGIKYFGKWVYGAVQGLVSMKWGIGSDLIGHYITGEYRIPTWMYEIIKMYMYSLHFGLMLSYEYISYIHPLTESS